METATSGMRGPLDPTENIKNVDLRDTTTVKLIEITPGDILLAPKTVKLIRITSTYPIQITSLFLVHNYPRKKCKCK